MTGEATVTVSLVILSASSTLKTQRLWPIEVFGFGFGYGYGFKFGLRLIVFVGIMGCSGSKVDDLPLVIRCRERKALIRAASDHRYALAAAHVAYFHSLKGVGDALRKFVDEELVLAATSSSSSTSSPVVTLHSLDEVVDEEKSNTTNNGNFSKSHKVKSKAVKSKSKSKSKASSSDESGSGASHVHDDDDDSHSHLHLSDDDDSVVSHIHDEDGDFNVQRDPGPGQVPYGYGYGYGYAGMNQPASEAYWGQYPSSFGVNQPYQAWGTNYENANANFGSNANVYYMQKSPAAMKTVIHEAEQVANGYSSSYYSYPFENEGFYGYPGGPGMEPGREMDGRKLSGRGPVEPPPPPSPKASTWDFFNPFDVYDNGDLGFYGYGYGHRSSSSSPDSTEVRKREGIPDLEEETENEVYREASKGKRIYEDVRSNRRHSGEGGSGLGSRAVPLQESSSEDSSYRVPLQKSSQAGYRTVPMRRSGESSSMAVPLQNDEGNLEPMPTPQPLEKSDAAESIDLAEENSSSEIALSSKSPEDVNVRKKGVSFEIDDAVKHDTDSSKLSGSTILSAHGTRDLREVVAEIRDEFAIASDHGKEVAVMLEVGKLPYQPNFVRVVFSRILYLISPSLSSSYPPSMRLVKLAAKTMKLAKSYFGEVGQDIDAKPCNISSTLEKLYAWEKKLYKEVKDEERFRVIYEKQCKRLQILDEQGAESSKIDPVRASIRKLLTNLEICIKRITSISNRIQKLRDEELQPQVAELIHGLIRMWNSMLRCHQKQFQAIMDSKLRALKANTGLQKDSSLRATLELEMELRTWCGHFNDWISTQKSYAESLNGWLLQCLYYEPEQTPDGPVPFSPGRLGAPAIFVICNDWNQAMETISETGVANAMHNFALRLQELWEKQDEEQRQRLKAEDMSKDIKKQLRNSRLEKGKIEHEQDKISDKTGVSLIPSENGVSPLDDLKVDLDMVRKRLAEERAKHKDAIKIVHDAASSSVQGGLVPIFKALESFSMEALKAHKQVRLQIDEQR